MNNIHLHIIGSQPFFDLFNELNLNYNISSDKNLKYNNKDLLVRIIFVEKLQLTEIRNFFLENTPTIFLLKNIWNRSSDLEVKLLKLIYTD